ncbi:hypothetical protein [Streptomyces griseofuscus]|uniref:hypothetical protein n=1 Tax=Streptomyces griseofuscus TaxID=146922 RepID=UPI003453F457
MVFDAQSVHRHVLRAVHGAVRQCPDAGRDTVARILADTFVADGMLNRASAWSAIEAHWNATAALVMEQVAANLRGDAPAARVAAANRLNKEIELLAQDVAAALTAADRLPAPEGGRQAYVSPSLHGSQADRSEVVAREELRGTKRAGPPVRDGEPGSAARRRARRAERRYRAARQIVDGLDEAVLHAGNDAVLRSLTAMQRVEVLWARHRGVVVIGRQHPCFGALAEVQDVPGIEVFPGFLQLVARPGPFGRFGRKGSARITGVPPEEEDRVRQSFAGYRIDAAFVPWSRWVG